MADREPAVLGELRAAAKPDESESSQGEAAARPETDGPKEAAAEVAAAPEAAAPQADSPAPETSPSPPESKAATPTPRARPQVRRFHAAGFWRRLAAGLVDLAIIAPVAMALSWLVGKLAGFGLPPNLGVDYWLDLLLGTDPSMVTLAVMLLATGASYAFVFQLTASQTPGMRLLRIRIIDVYGDPLAIARVGLRTAGYLANVVTLGLGFFWIGFDSEKRGLHDWIAGSYVVSAGSPDAD
jgi:uncharacterized RDD family membrane protein YckC